VIFQGLECETAVFSKAWKTARAVAAVYDRRRRPQAAATENPRIAPRGGAPTAQFTHPAYCTLHPPFRIPYPVSHIRILFLIRKPQGKVYLFGANQQEKP